MFFPSKKRFIEMAVLHGMARNLESEDQRKRAERNGSESLKQWEEQYRTDYTKMTSAINSALWSAFWIIVAVIVISIGVAVQLESVSPSLPLNVVKSTTFLGSALVAWATLMELGGDFPVWDGKAFPQLAHTVIFKAIFVPGVLLVLTSILIWRITTPSTRTCKSAASLCFCTLVIASVGQRERPQIKATFEGDNA